jgi:hypothetical protein
LKQSRWHESSRPSIDHFVSRFRAGSRRLPTPSTRRPNRRNGDYAAKCIADAGTPMGEEGQVGDDFRRNRRISGLECAYPRPRPCVKFLYTVSGVSEFHLMKG